MVPFARFVRATSGSPGVTFVLRMWSGARRGEDYHWLAGPLPVIDRIAGRTRAR